MGGAGQAGPGWPGSMDDSRVTCTMQLARPLIQNAGHHTCCLQACAALLWCRATSLPCSTWLQKKRRATSSGLPFTCIPHSGPARSTSRSRPLQSGGHSHATSQRAISQAWVHDVVSERYLISPPYVRRRLGWGYFVIRVRQWAGDEGACRPAERRTGLGWSSYIEAVNPLCWAYVSLLCCCFPNSKAELTFKPEWGHETLSLQWMLDFEGEPRSPAFALALLPCSLPPAVNLCGL